MQNYGIVTSGHSLVMLSFYCAVFFRFYFRRNWLTNALFDLFFRAQKNSDFRNQLLCKHNPP